jgi:hypothetical protein
MDGIVVKVPLVPPTRNRSIGWNEPDPTGVSQSTSWKVCAGSVARQKRQGNEQEEIAHGWECQGKTAPPLPRCGAL